MSDRPMSDQPTVVQALNAVMADVQTVRKDSVNRHQNFNFRGIDAVMNAVGPALRKHGVVIVPETLAAHYRDVTVGQKQTPMREATVHVRYIAYGPAGDTISGSVYGEALDSGDKGTAKAHSVAYRTFLLQALTIPTDEVDPDESSYERAAAPEPEPVTDEVMATVEDWIDAADDAGVEVDADKVRAYAVQSKAHADQSVETLKKRVEAAAVSS